MQQFEHTETAIAQDVNEVFTTIRDEIRSDYLSSSNHDLTYIRNALCQHIPKIVENKNALLFDTVLNYLTDDALKVLDKADNETINVFYEQNRRFRETLKTEFQRAFQTGIVTLSPDLRTVYAAGAGVIGGGLVGLLSRAVLDVWAQLALAAISGVLAFKVTYQKARPIAMNKIEEDVTEYLRQLRTTTLHGLQEIIAVYKSYFAKFLQERMLE